MDLDPLSIITPARVKVLLVPVGHVKQSRFAGFVQRLQSVNVVRLGDVSPDSRPHRSIVYQFPYDQKMLTDCEAMFSPLAFPEGLVLYDLSTSVPLPSHSALVPFEFNKEPLVVVGLADGNEYRLNAARNEGEKEENCKVREETSKTIGLRSLVRGLEDLIDEFSKALVHQILVFDHEEMSMPERIYSVPAPAKSRTTTIKTIMCDLTSRFLAEMATHAKSLQALPSLDSPRGLPNGAIKTNGAVSALPVHMIDSSRNESPRSSSPASGERSRADYRMSLPVNLPSNSPSGLSSSESRPNSPLSNTRAPPILFSEHTGTSRVQSPPNASNQERASSGSRISVTASTNNVIAERERNKGKGRIGIVIGAMYLLAGRWPDAVKELVQSAAIARNVSDYIWHAKAMDYVLICLLMYAWTGMDFRIPENLFPGTEKPGSSSSKSSKHTTPNSLPELNVSKSVDPFNRAASLHELTSLLPDLANNLLNLYGRAWTFTDDRIPPTVFSQTAIRFAKLLSAIHRSSGTLNDNVLRHVVLNAELSSTDDEASKAAPILASGEIVELLFRGYPGPPSSEMSMPVADRTTVLAGIASVLSDLGYHRKKALILKELMTGLLPALVQARKDGAAEMGVHPAASLASLDSAASAMPLEKSGAELADSERGMWHFLSYVCRSYGIVPFELVSEKVASTVIRDRRSLEDTSYVNQAQSSDILAFQALRQASAKAFGSQDLKLDILRSCISICEALPDLGGALRFSAELLRIGGSGVAPGPESSNGSPDLVIEEQVRLVSNISRTLSAARQLGIEHPQADYWDAFLVRGIEAVNDKSSKSLQPHAKAELELVDTSDIKEKNPFIYNPFLKSKTTATKESLLVAMQETLFRVTLQNLYDFEVVVERISLLADGVELDCEAQSTIIGAYRTQTIILGAIPQSSGSLVIHGCSAKVRGCRERNFPTFAESWALRSDAKGKYLVSAGQTRPNSVAPEIVSSKNSSSSRSPIPSTLALDVLVAQPTLALKLISASQAAIMLLEGETTSLTITVQNTSRSMSVDLLLLSFDDSTASRRLSAFSSGNLSAVEIYELELASARKQPFNWRRKAEDQDIRIEVGGEIKLEIEILGRPDLSHGTIQVDYGHLGVPKAEVKEKFYTRQLIIPLTVTVNPSIKILSADIVALPSGFSLQQKSGREEKIQMTEDSIQNYPAPSPTEFQSRLENINDDLSNLECLLLLDLRNLWSQSLDLILEVSDPTSPDPPTRRIYNISSSTTERIPIPLRRLYISNPYAPIPSINPANKRQFIVSATKHTAQAERAMRKSFWYREALLDRLKAKWKETSTERSGAVDLRGLQMSSRSLSALKLPDLGIDMSVTNAEPASSTSHTNPESMNVQTTGPSEYTVPILTLLTLNTHLFNRSSTPIQPLLRLQPSLANQPQNVALDLSKKLLVNGLLQRALPTLGPGERATIETGFLVLNYGTYEWGASVEEVVPSGKAPDNSGRARAATGELDVLSDIGRRIWVAESPCTVVARDAGSDPEADRIDNDE